MSETATSSISYALLVTGEQGTSRHPLQHGRSVVIGSSPHCGIQIAGKDVASMHCVIDLNDGVLGIQDWASPTGTIVNGTPITARISICENDQVKIGSATIAIRRTVTDLDRDEKDHEPATQSDECDLEDSYLTSEIDLENAVDDSAELETETPIGERSSDEVPPPEPEPVAVQHDWASGFDAPIDHPAASDPWDAADEFDQYDAETVQLLKAEIDDLRSMLADRDAQVDQFSRSSCFDTANEQVDHSDQDAGVLQRRVDELLAEAAENDERVQIHQGLLEAAELKNQAESEERLALEAWVGEIEHRMGQRETEWKAEIESVREQLSVVENERNQLQHKLREVASRFGAKDVYRETLDQLQADNATLQQQLGKLRKQAGALKQQLDNVQNRESEEIQHERALVAKERADVSRMRFELSRKLSEFEQSTPAKMPADQDIDVRVQALRSHLREIHEQEKREREERGESLFSRISGMWKKMDEF